MIFGAVLMIGSGATIVGYRLAVHEATGSINRQNLIGAAGPGPVHQEITGAKNILLVGVDSRPGQDPTNLVRSDSIMILHLAANHDAGYLISIPRDTWVRIPAYDNGEQRWAGGQDKINAAFAVGGEGLTGAAARQHSMELLALTIKNNFHGITFNAAAIVDFVGFQEVVAVLGKVDMCVDEVTRSIHVGYRNGKQVSPAVQINSDGTVAGPLPGVTPKEYDVGCYPMLPWEALDYVRQRDLLANGDADYGRQRHQQQFLKAVFKQVLSTGVLTSPGKLSRVLNAMGRAMTVDDGGVPIEDWLFAMRGIGGDDLITIKTNDGQFNSETIDGKSIETLDDTSMELMRSVRDDTVDSFVRAHPDWVANS
jgi:anionic cell wall polymer biosynthesis LytR-Cps2A-Psr (LCP) family protein